MNSNAVKYFEILPEDEMPKGDNFFEDVFENINDGLVIFQYEEESDDFKIDGVSSMSGKSDSLIVGNIRGMSLHELYSGIKKEKLIQILKRVLKTGKKETYSVNMYNNNGKNDIFRKEHYYRIGQNKVLMLLRDFTTQKILQRKLEEFYEKFKFFIDSKNVRIEIMDYWQKNHTGNGVEVIEKEMDGKSYKSIEIISLDKYGDRKLVTIDIEI